MFPIIQELLQRYQDRLETKAIIIDHDASRKGLPALKEHLPPGPWLLGADSNTWAAAGEELAQLLSAQGLEWTRYQISEPADGTAPICSDALVQEFKDAIDSTNAVGAIAIGAGTVNDVVKMASYQAGIPMACIATAPSMNGYTSGIAAILSDGVKTTNPCAAPRVVIADVDVMANSPYRMICSGLGDLISKPVSNADWQLSAFLNDSFHSADAMEIIEAGAAMLDGVAEKLPARDPQAVAGLTASLMLSGLAMSVAGSSSPASGGEHLISHFIDMTAYAFGEPHDFHGCQVGVGTITTAMLYERLQALDPAQIDVQARVDALPDWDDYEATLKERFGPLFDAVVKHARPGYPSKDELQRRLTRLKEGWDQLLEQIGRTLRTGQSLEDELRRAKCPVRFADLGVEADRARRSIVHSKDIRNRYTILHLAWELGLLDEWAQQALTKLAS